MRGPALRQVTSGVPALGVVQALVERLQKCNAILTIHTDGVPEGLPDTLVDAVHVADDERSREQDDEKHKHDEVENGETNDTSLAELRLLEGVDRRTDLTAAR